MSNNKGFSLAECVVAVAIVMLISLALVSTCLIAVSNTNKANALQIINNESLNLAKIIKTIDIENGGEYEPEKLEKSLLEYYGKVFNLSEDKLNTNESIFLKDDGEIGASGNIQIVLTFFKKDDYLVLTMSGYYKQNQIKKQSVIFEKYVESWGV